MNFSESNHLRLLVRAFQYRNYRLFFAGQSISLIGTWTQQVAMSWLVYRLTGSAFLLGAVAFCNQIPTFFLSPFAGVIADRLNRQRLLLCTQSLSMLQAMTLSALVLTGTIRTWQIVGLSLFIGIVNAFDIPARQSFVVEMVDKKEDLGNAIALNSAMFNGARFIGPSVAGILISTLGEGICFLLNGISYVAVLMALAAIRMRPRQDREGTTHVWQELCEGVAYAYHFKPIMAILCLLAVFSLAGSPYVVLMPVYAKEVLHGGAHTFGFLMSAAGIGALASTMYLASRKSVLGLEMVIPLAASGCGVAIAAFAISRNFTLSLVFLFLAGFGMMTQIASSNTIVQTIVDEDKRGRVMSLYAMSLMGMMPFGSLLAGAVAGKIGVQHTLLLGATFCIIGALIFASKLRRLRELVRPIYAKMGLIPETTAWLHAETKIGSAPGKD
jgi:MFS family permease